MIQSALQSWGVRGVVLTVCWRNERVSCQRNACNGSLASCPVQALWDTAQTYHFFHTLSHLPHSLLPTPLDCLSVLSSLSSRSLSLSPLLNSDLDRDHCRPLISMSLSLAQTVCCTHANNHTHSHRISLSMQDSGGAFSDYIPHDGLLYSRCSGFLMGSQVNPQ